MSDEKSFSVCQEMLPLFRTLLIIKAVEHMEWSSGSIKAHRVYVKERNGISKCLEKYLEKRTTRKQWILQLLLVELALALDGNRVDEQHQLHHLV